MEWIERKNESKENGKDMTRQLYKKWRKWIGQENISESLDRITYKMKGCD